MKNQKLKNTAIKNAKRNPKQPKADLVSFKISEHKFTGKLIHHRHTSHIALLGILIVTGFFMYFNKSIALAEVSSSVSVSVVIPGLPPVIGATITDPKNGDIINGDSVIKVKGTCAADTYVVIKSNQTIIGSTLCSSSGNFELKVQLLSGDNALSALNYDNLNQSGPVTGVVNVSLKEVIKTSKENVKTSLVATEVVPPATPANPSIITGVKSTISSCNDYIAPSVQTGGEPHMSVVCIPRLLEANTEQTLGFLVWGGIPPYAVSVDWGDESDQTLISLATQGFHKELFKYKIAGKYNITFKLKDSIGATAFVQTAVQVSGAGVTPVEPINSLKDELFNPAWLKTPVPFYFLAVAITFGFWGGDIFDRYFGNKKPHHKRRKIAHS